MDIEELNLLIDICDEYVFLGQGGRIRLTEIISGDSLDNHPDTLLKAISLWLQKVATFLDEPRVATNLVDDIEMYLFGNHLEEERE